MSVYDTRFFFEHYYFSELETLRRTKAELRHKYRIPMADSMIAATAKQLGLTCVTDDPHLTQIREIKTRWI